MSTAPRRRTLSQVHVVIAAVLGLATGSVALLFQLAPGLRPDPRDRVGADVAVFALEPRAKIGDWIKRGFPVSEQAALVKRYPDRGAIGELLYVRTTVDGHKHRNVSLRFGVYFAKKQTIVPPDDIDAPPSDPQPLSAPNERSVTVLWVPDLSRETGLFIRVELWDEGGILAVTDSPCIENGRFKSSPTAGEVCA